MFQRPDSDEHEAEVLEKVKLPIGWGVDLNAVDHEGRTALDGAMESEYDLVVAFLREAGAERGNRMPG